MTVPDLVLHRCFPELWGFVLLDPQRLADAVPDALGKDVMALLGGTDLGDRVTAEGVAVPILNLTAGYYTIVLRDQTFGTPWADPVVSSTGWVLGTDTGELLLCGAGYLTNWNPSREQHRRIAIPPGWYQLDIDGYLLGDDNDDDYALVLTVIPTAGRPAFTADTEFDFSLGRFE